MGHSFSCHPAAEFQNQEASCMLPKSMLSGSVQDSLSNYSCDSLSSTSHHDELDENNEFIKNDEVDTSDADSHQIEDGKCFYKENPDVPPKSKGIKTLSKISTQSAMGKQRGWDSMKSNQCEVQSERNALSDIKNCDQVKNVDIRKTHRSTSSPTSPSKSDNEYAKNSTHYGSLLQRFLRLKKSPQLKERDILNQKCPKSKERRALVLVDVKRDKRGSASCDPVLVGDEHYVLMQWSNPGKKRKSGQLASHWRVRARQQGKL